MNQYASPNGLFLLKIDGTSLTIGENVQTTGKNNIYYQVLYPNVGRNIVTNDTFNSKYNVISAPIPVNASNSFIFGQSQEISTTNTVSSGTKTSSLLKLDASAAPVVPSNKPAAQATNGNNSEVLINLLDTPEAINTNVTVTPSGANYLFNVNGADYVIPMGTNPNDVASLMKNLPNTIPQNDLASIEDFLEGVSVS